MQDNPSYIDAIDNKKKGYYNELRAIEVGEWITCIIPDKFLCWNELQQKLMKPDELFYNL